MKNFLFGFLLSVLVAGAVALTGATSVNATSVHDNAIRYTNDIIIRSPDGVYEYSVKAGDYHWKQYVDTDASCNSTQRTYLDTAIASGSVIIFQNGSGLYGGSSLNVGIRYNTVPTTIPASNFYYDGGSGISALGANTGDLEATIYVTNAGAIRARCANTTDFQSWVSSNGTIIDAKIFSNTYDIQYPSGYEGLIVPEDGEVDPDIEVPDYNPIISINFQVENRKLTFWDTTLYPEDLLDTIQCRWSVASVADGMVFDVLGACTDEVRVLEDLEYGDYALQRDIIFDTNGDTWYNVEDPAEVVGTAQLEFTIDGQNFSGGAGNDWTDIIGRVDFYSCVSETFPFFNYTDCLSNIQVVIGLLSFKTIDFGNYWSSTASCHTMGTLGDWMQAPSALVCPQIPSAVRTITTPFVTFALGLLGLKFLTRREGYLT